jgi:voltage-gated potassium channel
MQSPLLTFLALTGNAVMIVASLAFWWAERGNNANVTHYADALWWAFATVSTVGYGDVVPVTAAGRGIAIVLITTGVFFFVVFGAALATIILRITTEEVLKKDESLSREETATILREIASLRQEIEKLRRP